MSTNLLRIHSGAVHAPSLVRFACAEYLRGRKEGAINTINESCLGGNDAKLAKEIVSGRARLRIHGDVVFVATHKDLGLISQKENNGKLVSKN